MAAALTSAAIHTVSAAAFNQVGDLNLEDGSFEKIMVKALVGGAISQAATGDFATGALAAGANEALVEHLAGLVDHDPNLLSMASQLVGALSSTVSGGDPNLAANIANYDTQYNYLNHRENKRYLAELKGCEERGDCVAVKDKYQAISQANETNAKDVIQAAFDCTTDCADILGQLRQIEIETMDCWQMGWSGLLAWGLARLRLNVRQLRGR